jgi:hypothetical protein
MEQNILRALHKNFLPKEIQEHFENYLNWRADEDDCILVVYDSCLEYGKSISNEYILNESIEASMKALCEFMQKNNIQVILND